MMRSCFARFPWRVALACLIAWISSSGCDSGSTPKPRPPASSVSNPPLLPPPPVLGQSQVLDLVMVSAQTGSPAVGLWEQAARREAGLRNAVFDLVKVPSSGGSAAFAEQVLRAVRRGPDGLILAPGPNGSGDLSAALEEAARQKTVLVSIREPIRVGQTSLPTVVRADYLPGARNLVEAIVQDAQVVGLSPTGPAMVLVNSEGTDAASRAEALTTALGEAGIPLVGDSPVSFSGGEPAAVEKIQAARKEHGSFPMIFTTEDDGFRAATSERDALPAGERYVYAGFVEDNRNLNMVRASFAVAAVYCPDLSLGKQAVLNVVAATKGESLPDRIEVPLPFSRAATPPSQAKLGYEGGPESSRPVVVDEPKR